MSADAGPYMVLMKSVCWWPALASARNTGSLEHTRLDLQRIALELGNPRQARRARFGQSPLQPVRILHR